MRIGASVGKFSHMITAQANGDLDPGWLVRQVEALLPHGPDQVEVLTDGLVCFPESFTRETFAEIAALCKGKSTSIHLPFWLIDPSSPNEAMRRDAVANILRTVELTEPMAPDSYVMHMTSFVADSFGVINHPPVTRAAGFDLLLKQAGESLAEIVKQVDRVRLCVENMEAVPFDLTWETLKHIGTSICYDVGHDLLQGGHYLEFMVMYFPRIREIHLHDVARDKFGAKCTAFSDHRDIGTGIMDIGGIIHELKDRNYKGSIILEVANPAISLAAMEKYR
jgi:sugar phosphate isomerase/epimerase